MPELLVKEVRWSPRLARSTASRFPTVNRQVRSNPAPLSASKRRPRGRVSGRAHSVLRFVNACRFDISGLPKLDHFDIVRTVKTITYTAPADRQLAAMTPDARERIEAKIERYAELGEGDVKAMKGSPTLRPRVDAYRVIFTEHLEILDVLDVGHRSRIYQ